MHLFTRNINTAFTELVGALTARRGLPGVCTDIPIVRRPSRNGPVIMIDEPVMVTYTHPRERVLFNQARDANPFLHLYHVLWMLAGRNDVTPLEYYASNMANYSDDGRTLNGAYGYRWRKALDKDREGEFYSHPIDQLRILIDHLKSDPTSRRAVLQMWNVEDDLLKIGHTKSYQDFEDYNNQPSEQVSKDVCCNTAVYFSIREQSISTKGMTKDQRDEVGHDPCQQVLDMTVTNRSNDLIWGMLGEDYVTFSVLQEYVAAQVGVEVGRYDHFTNNLHVYESNWKPDEWLAVEETQNRKTRDYIEQPLNMVPLVKDPKTFDEELPLFVEINKDGEPTYARPWQEPFLADAQTILNAFHNHKDREYGESLAWCERIKADDWRVAATNWITKRKEGHERRNKAAV